MTTTRSARPDARPKATALPDTASGASVELQALIEEARRRARRRRLTWAAVAIAVLASVTGYLITSGGDSTPPSSGSKVVPPAGVVKSVGLPRSDLYESLALVDRRLIVSGGPDGSLFPSGTIASAPHSPPSKICHAATVNPVTLKLSDQHAGPCEDPALYGVRVLPMNFAANGQGFTSTVRISRHTNTGRGYRVGPVVMRYMEASDTDAEWAYGDGNLWLYDPTTTHGSELLQINATTGAVLDTIRMPVITRPLIATNDDGFWLAPAITSGFTGNPPIALYHVAPGARAPVIAARIAGNAHWLVANGHSIWVDVNHYPRPSTLWRFDGPGARPVFHRTISHALDYLQFARGESEYGGDQSGLWAVVPGHGQHVIRINANTGQTATIATVQTL